MAKIAQKAVSFENGTVTFRFANGTERIIDTAALSDDIKTHLMLHGLSQKAGDSYSGAETVTEALEKFNSTVDSLLAGDWNVGRAATGGIWVDAIARAANVTREEALAKWNESDDDTRKALRKHTAIKAAKAAIDLERAEALAKAAGESDTKLDFDSI